MKKYFRIILALSIFNSACAHGLNERHVASESASLTRKTNMVSLETYEKEIATYRVEICPANGKVNVDIQFAESGDPSLVYAELSFFVPKEQCYANTSQLVKVNISSEIKAAALEKGIKASVILMKSIPHRIEVDQF